MMFPESLHSAWMYKLKSTFSLEVLFESLHVVCMSQLKSTFHFQNLSFYCMSLLKSTLRLSEPKFRKHVFAKNNILIGGAPWKPKCSLNASAKIIIFICWWPADVLGRRVGRPAGRLAGPVWHLVGRPILCMCVCVCWCLRMRVYECVAVRMCVYASACGRGC